MRYVLILLLVACHTMVLAQEKIYITDKGETYTKDELHKLMTSDIDSTFTFQGFKRSRLSYETLSVKVKDGKEIHKIKIHDRVAEEAGLSKYYNQPLPDFTWIDLKGNTVSSQSLKGKKVVITFWAISCAPCVAEFPLLNKLQERYPDVAFISITNDSQKDVEDFLKKRSLATTVVRG